MVGARLSLSLAYKTGGIEGRKDFSRVFSDERVHLGARED